jgi:hypothetical protein
VDGHAAARARPIALFGLFAAVTLAAEVAVVGSRQFPLHPRLLTTGVVFDLVVTVPAAWWFLMVRPGVASKRSLVRIACLGIAVSALLFGRSMRALVLPLEALLLVWAFRAARAALQTGGDGLERIRAACTGVFGDNAISRAVATELSVFYSALAPRRREHGFTHGRKAGWSAVAFVLGLVTVAEAIPVELFLCRFGNAPAAIAAAIPLYALLWFLGDARALRNRVTRIDGGTLRLRLGLRWTADIPLRLIESVETGRAPLGSLQLKVLGSTNLVLRLRQPIEVTGLFGITRRSSTLAVQLDDPEGLAAALRPLPSTGR